MPKLIIGLGNPDPEYSNTYHNVGFLFVDYLGKGIKSEVYMNESGKFVAKELSRFRRDPAFKTNKEVAGEKSAEELLIVHDDSDIELGKYKLSFGRGAAGHHGVESIQAALKTNNFWRLRIGIRPANEKVRQKSEKFVLKKITATDKKILERVFEEIAKEF